LEKELGKERKEKADEIDGRKKDKDAFEMRIKELEDEVRVLKSESGD